MIPDFERFWPVYLREHANWTNKLLHVFGTATGMVCHFVLVWVTGSLWWLVIGLLFGYACAWTGHFLVERNKPAMLKHPYWSFFGDLEQFFLMLCGWMRQELAVLARDGCLPPSPARRAFRAGIRAFAFSYYGVVLWRWWAGALSFGAPLF